MAIGTVLMVGSISAGLAATATSSLQNRTTLEQVRNREYAADAAIEDAIVIVRGAQYTCASLPTSFLRESSLNGFAIRVDWSNACTQVLADDAQTVYDQRNVIFTTCPDTGVTCIGAPNVIIRAQVNFDPASGPVTETHIQSWSVNR
jgi:hypothetical protein